ncbi:hypothetical protein EUGRSUZ_C03725 [Eucalyptus grandis]|uniref:Uncharacterized protein n=2 Tax=Eucalyptus grandis TaxID=71139 RepID=A0ACC3LJG4_EUCGR|nr:hypothetical protein EUGRSUZ_C03725 [Eucalyptus grandis]
MLRKPTKQKLPRDKLLMQSSFSTLKLPQIDLYELDGSKSGTGRWDSSQSQLRQALEEFGCFEALHDKMTLKLHNDAFQELEELLKLPNDVKCRFDFLDKLETMNTYVTRVLELDSLVKKLVLGSLGVDKYLESLAKLVRYNFRLMRYAAPGTEESKKSRAWCHRDANFVIVLHQNHVNGLEVQTKDGCWFEVAPSSATSLTGWSNGRLHGDKHSPCHRVMMSGHEARYCIGLFSSVQGTIQCPDELVDDQHPLLFKSFDVAGLSRIYKTKEGDGYLL